MVSLHNLIPGVSVDNQTIIRRAMSLYSGTNNLQSHICRFIMLAKDAESEIRYVDEHFNMSELAELNPYGEVPTLVDREFVIYGLDIVVEYLDERLPHPPLLPVDPVLRGRARLMIYRLTRDWLHKMYAYDNGELKQLDAQTKKDIKDGLVSISPVLAEQDYLLGDEISLVDFLYGSIFVAFAYSWYQIAAQTRQANAFLCRAHVLNRKFSSKLEQC